LLFVEEELFAAGKMPLTIAQPNSEPPAKIGPASRLVGTGLGLSFRRWNSLDRSRKLSVGLYINGSQPYGCCCRIFAKVVVTAPIDRRTNRTRHKTTAAVWAHILDYLRDAETQNVHSKLQIMASAELAGRSFPQFSQIGRISNIGWNLLIEFQDGVNRTQPVGSWQQRNTVQHRFEPAAGSSCPASGKTSHSLCIGHPSKFVSPR
jgi:hypothetical protein